MYRCTTAHYIGCLSDSYATFNCDNDVIITFANCMCYANESIIRYKFERAYKIIITFLFWT